ncbi:MAG: hypothetical protein ABR970_17270 [Roseiarcus sp.]|jgi:hypothetical protein
MSEPGSGGTAMLGARRHLLVIYGALGGLVVMAVIGLLIVLSMHNFNALENVTACVDRYAAQWKVEHSNMGELSWISTFCYNTTGSQLLIDEESIRRDNFIFQRHENAVLLMMVVAITLSGVGLAGLQLLASYKLAVMGKGDLAGGAELSYSKDNMSFKSSVVGLAILAVSFGFFLVFVVDVYELKEGDSTSHPGMPRGTGLQVSDFVPNGATGVGRTDAAQPTAPDPAPPPPSANGEKRN